METQGTSFTAETAVSFSQRVTPSCMCSEWMLDLQLLVFSLSLHKPHTYDSSCWYKVKALLKWKFNKNSTR